MVSFTRKTPNPGEYFMSPRTVVQTAPFAATYFPLHAALLSVGENVMPVVH